MEVPDRFRGYPCESYFRSPLAEQGHWDEAAQIWLMLPAGEVIERPERELLVVGRPGFDGLEWGFRKGYKGVWIYYPIDDEFQYLALTAQSFLEGWLSGAIKV
ncbi:hypothetical protein AYO44_16400 [Planctomycetaceae bacterium SCGC AG-212-F19]|nr:hypothetical protein AYO44_16400 [Planctomycetaceae bacterium SCGC AG-212-F19]